MIQKKWFRIETDKDGAILSCEEVSSKGRQGAVVRYYEALTKADACKQAKEWQRERANRNSANTKERRSRLNAQGKCGICRRAGPISPGGVCKHCRSAEAKRAKELASGAERKIRRYADPMAALDAERLSKANTRARIVAKWGSTRAYDTWLVLRRLREEGAVALDAFLCSSIRKAGGGAALDEYERERAKQCQAAAE